jgi:hypothetical protein
MRPTSAAWPWCSAACGTSGIERAAPGMKEAASGRFFHAGPAPAGNMAGQGIFQLQGCTQV